MYIGSECSSLKKLMQYTIKKAGDHFAKGKENQSSSIKSIESDLCFITRNS